MAGQGKKRGRGRPKKQTGSAAKKLKSNAAEVSETNGSEVESGSEVTIEPRTLDLDITLKSTARTKVSKGDPNTVDLKIKVESATENKNIVIAPQIFDVKVKLEPETLAKGKKKTERTVGLNLMIEPKVSKQLRENEPTNSTNGMHKPKTILEIRREDPNEEYENFIERVKNHTTPEYRKYLQDLSQQSEEWKRFKIGRITASSFATAHNFDCAEGPSEERDMVNSIVLGTSSSGSAPPLKYGTDNKEKAKALYLRNPHTHKKPKSVRLTECGLFLDQENPLIGASPNWLIKCDCCPDGIVQVKCCYKHRDKPPQDIPRADSKYHFTYNKQKKLALDSRSYWYYQVVGLLGVTEMSYCDLVVYTDKGIAIVRVPGDADLYDAVVEESGYIYEEWILPDLTEQC